VVAEIFADVADRSPYLSSTREVILIGSSGLGLVTATVNVKSPPGATRLNGLATLVTEITGTGRGVNVTVAFAVAIAVLPSESTPITVTTSVCEAPDTPVNCPVKLHGGLVCPGASVTPISVLHVVAEIFADVADRSPYLSSTREVILIGSFGLGLVTATVNVNAPPGATRLNGLATLVTEITGTGITVTGSAPHALDTAALLASPL
jgi:hypothetical protein